MTAFSRIALIGFGEVGQTLAPDLIKAGAHVSAFDLLFATPDSAPARAAKSIPVRKALSHEDAVNDAELVIVAVTAAADLDAAKQVAPHLANDAFYLDVNSVSPGMKQACAAHVEASRGRYVEAAVMTPINPKGVGSYMLLGGPHAAAFIEHARPLGFIGEVFSDRIGQASATKMCRSVVIKGMEALLSESMLAARAYGVEKTVLNSLSDLLPVGDWDRVARYMISRALEHGQRRAEEMREAAKTVAEVGVMPLMAMATAERQDISAPHKAALIHANDLGAMLDAIHHSIKQGGAAAPTIAREFP